MRRPRPAAPARTRETGMIPRFLAAPPTPTPMHLPNYRDGSLVNLMQSILAGLGASGAGDGAHGHLSSLAPEEVADARHVVLVVVDGLGQAQLESGPAPALRATAARHDDLGLSLDDGLGGDDLSDRSGAGRARDNRVVHVAAPA